MGKSEELAGLEGGLGMTHGQLVGGRGKAPLESIVKDLRMNSVLKQNLAENR